MDAFSGPCEPNLQFKEVDEATGAGQARYRCVYFNEYVHALATQGAIDGVQALRLFGEASSHLDGVLLRLSGSI